MMIMMIRTTFLIAVFGLFESASLYTIVPGMSYLLQSFYNGNSRIGDDNIFECYSQQAKNASWRVVIDGYERDLVLWNHLCIHGDETFWYEYGFNSSVSWIVLYNITAGLNKSLWKCCIKDDVWSTELITHSYPDYIHSEVTLGNFIERHQLRVTNNEHAVIHVGIGCSYPYPIISAYLNESEEIPLLKKQIATTGSGFTCNDPFKERESTTNIHLQRRTVSSERYIKGRICLMIEIGMRTFFVKTKTTVEFTVERSDALTFIDDLVYDMKITLQRIFSYGNIYSLQPTTNCVTETPTDVYVSCVTCNKTVTDMKIINVTSPVNLTCKFTPLNDDALYYNIDWYIDEDVVIKGQTVQKSTMDQAVLHAVDFISKGNVCKIRCEIGAKKVFEGKTCTTISSLPFYAGVELHQTVSISKGEATTANTSVFEQCEPYRQCPLQIQYFINSSLENCIQLTGQNHFNPISYELAMANCILRIQLNKTLQSNQSEQYYQITQMCLNNCSQNGICNQGYCTCDIGYSSSDCLMKLYYNLSVNEMSPDRFCDKLKDTCDEITMTDLYFVESMGEACYMLRREFQAIGRVKSDTIFEVTLTERTLYEGYFQIQYETNDTWLTEFYFDVSIDGLQITPTDKVHVYETFCQTINDELGSGYVSLKFQAIGRLKTETMYEVKVPEGTLYEGYCLHQHELNDARITVFNFNISVYRRQFTPSGKVYVYKSSCQYCNNESISFNCTLQDDFYFIDGVCDSDQLSNTTDPCMHCASNSNKFSWSLREETVSSEKQIQQNNGSLRTTSAQQQLSTTNSEEKTHTNTQVATGSSNLSTIKQNTAVAIVPTFATSSLGLMIGQQKQNETAIQFKSTPTNLSLSSLDNYNLQEDSLNKDLLLEHLWQSMTHDYEVPYQAYANVPDTLHMHRLRSREWNMTI